MLNSKWGGSKKKKKNEKVNFVKKAGDGIDNHQNTVQKARGGDVTAVAVLAIAVAIGNTNINVPINIPIANQATGGSINKESGPGNLFDNDDADFDIL